MSRGRGMALLLVLAALVVVVTGAASLARIAATAQIERRSAAADRIAGGLLDAADAPILAWLESESHRVVLPPDAPDPSVDVLHDIIVLDDTDCELTITAYDQLGMIPLREALRGSPLRLALPSWARDSLSGFEARSNRPAGLDDLARHTDTPVFPCSVPSETVVFGAGTSSPSSREQPEPALGSHVATHNPLPNSGGRVRRRVSPPAINVNTATMDVVEAALRAAGRGGLEQITAARTEGKPFAPGDAPVIRQGSGINLVASSSVWAFRIDTRVDRVRRAWWCVYALDGTDWKLVQRLVVTE